jgi:hypothetical protein
MTTRPGVAQILREKIAGDGADSLAAKARRRRWNLFLARFPDIETASVIDLGGTAAFWARSPVRPGRLTVVNLPSATSHSVPPDVEVIVGDACAAADLVKGKTYDIVFSNSTIEHVGGHDRCQAFASSVRRLAPRHWIQTPYRYFPIEPHFVFPGFQFLPVALRSRLAAIWPLSYTKSIGGELDDPLGAVLATELLGRTQLGYYFPDSKILSERVLGITKSIIAVSS